MGCVALVMNIMSAKKVNKSLVENVETAQADLRVAMARVELESQKVSETSLRNHFSTLNETGLSNLFLLLLRLVSETFFLLLLILVSETFFLPF